MLPRVEWVPIIVVDVLVVVAWSVLVGATAPRWPTRWLEADTGPLRLSRRETVAGYRATGLPALADRLPELGAAFGGTSKRTIPGRGAADLAGYLVEVRRAEWVHWLSCLALVPLAWWNPWWLWLAFALVVTVVNGVFIAILRHNHLRLVALLRRVGA